MDKISKKFDEWAINGKAESMEKGHGGNVLKFLNKIFYVHLWLIKTKMRSN